MNPNYDRAGGCTGLSGHVTCSNPCITADGAFPIYSNETSCSVYMLQAVNNARNSEHVGPMVLPSNWFTLNPPQQLFVLANLERTARGLPPYLGINAALSRAAQHAAVTNSDPGNAPGFAARRATSDSFAVGRVWAAGTFTTIGADYGWMYDDGWGGATVGFNSDCNSSQALACWAHRDALLGLDSPYHSGAGLWCTNCEMGLGYTKIHGYSSYADLIEMAASTPPAMTFTWAKNVVPFLRR